MKLDKLLERLDYTVVQGSDSTEVTTLINDSRKVEEGSVFVCISGAVSDGHKYESHRYHRNKRKDNNNLYD